MGEVIKALGIMGGTFDPIHFGHLLIAEESRLRFGLDKVVFVPAGQPAHKFRRDVAESEHRYAMTLIATASNPHFFCSRVEIERPGPSYAIDTVGWFKSEYPEAEVYFITGIDAVADIMTWYEHPRLKDMCRFIAATRPGYDADSLQRVLPVEYLNRIDVLEVPGVDVSGTEIRRRVAEGLTLRYLVPEGVESYIMKNSLYVREK
jgi:nicotinate-nucleotide adenylyltransferase